MTNPTSLIRFGDDRVVVDTIRLWKEINRVKAKLMLSGHEQVDAYNAAITTVRKAIEINPDEWRV